MGRVRGHPDAGVPQPGPPSAPVKAKPTSVLSPIEPIARLAIHTFCRGLVTRRLVFTVEGLDRLPRRGPVLLASRHYHHFYDAALLMTVMPRPVHFLVALDWVHGPWQRRLMELACRAAQWPAMLRVEQLEARSASRRTYRVAEAGPYLRQAVHDSVGLLRAGRALVVFPEAYPTVDPEGSPKRADDVFLPFRPGFLKLARLAGRASAARVPIVPTGLHYERLGAPPGPRWRVALRFGTPIHVDAAVDPAQAIQDVEDTVRALSEPTPVRR